MSEERKGSENFAGEVNILNEECTELELTIDGKKCFGFKNDLKKTDRHPDYRIYDSKDKENEIGVAWQGETKTGKDKLSLKLKDYDDYWVTAVMNEKEDGPSMYIFKNPKNA